MFPIPWQLTVFIIVCLTLVVFVICIVVALVLNMIYRTPAKSFLVSSGLIETFSFVFALVGTISLPGSLTWLNSKPQNLRTALYDYGLAVSLFTASLCIAFWQIISLRLSRNHIL